MLLLAVLDMLFRDMILLPLLLLHFEDDDDDEEEDEEDAVDVTGELTLSMKLLMLRLRVGDDTFHEKTNQNKIYYYFCIFQISTFHITILSL